MRHVGNGAVALLLAAGVGGLAGCGGEERTLSAQHRDELHADIESVRASVERDRNAAALARMDDFRATVRDLADRGELSDADASVLLTQADRIAAGLKVAPSPKVTPSATTSPAAASAPPDPPSPGEGKDEGKPKGKDKPGGKGSKK